MRYSLIIILVIFLCSGTSAQLFISGPTTVCPDDHDTYSIPISGCGYQVEILSWAVVGGTWDGILDHSIDVTWDIPDADVGSVDVLYRCWPNPDIEDSYVQWAFGLDIDIRDIKKPLFDVASIDLIMGENDPFTITTPNQSVGFTYDWTFPECLIGTDGSYETTVFPDLVETGTICLTVTNTYCSESYMECIEVTRSCLDYKTYFDLDDVPVFTNVNLDINTSGNVVTTAPDVEFKAGRSINLNPGFCANADFLAHIGGCTGPSGEDCIWGSSTSGLVSAIDPNMKNETSHLHVDLEHVKPMTEDREIFNRNEFKTRISPNPALDNFLIWLDKYDPSQNYRYEIIGLDGRSLLKGQILDTETYIDISNLGKGIYLVKIFTTSNISIKRLLKQ